MRWNRLGVARATQGAKEKRHEEDFFGIFAPLFLRALQAQLGLPSISLIICRTTRPANLRVGSAQDVSNPAH